MVDFKARDDDAAEEVEYGKENHHESDHFPRIRVFDNIACKEAEQVNCNQCHDFVDDLDYDCFPRVEWSVGRYEYHVPKVQQEREQNLKHGVLVKRHYYDCHEPSTIERKEYMGDGNFSTQLVDVSKFRYDISKLFFQGTLLLFFEFKFCLHFDRLNRFTCLLFCLSDILICEYWYFLG